VSDLAEHYLAEVKANFQAIKTQGERAMAQAEDADLFRGLEDGGESNSIAVLVQHLRGNMLSRWTDFLTTDGEKPSRDRDAEFVGATASRAELMARWEEGWACLFAALEGLAPGDLQRTVAIRGHDHTVVQAINRQIIHYAGHVAQIVYVAKHFKAGAWKSLSIPRGQSKTFAFKPLKG
jgi:hypothetical protein